MLVHMDRDLTVDPVDVPALEVGLPLVAPVGDVDHVGYGVAEPASFVAQSRPGPEDGTVYFMRARGGRPVDNAVLKVVVPARR